MISKKIKYLFKCVDLFGIEIKPGCIVAYQASGKSATDGLSLGVVASIDKKDTLTILKVANTWVGKSLGNYTYTGEYCVGAGYNQGIKISRIVYLRQRYVVIEKPIFNISTPGLQVYIEHMDLLREFFGDKYKIGNPETIDNYEEILKQLGE